MDDAGALQAPSKYFFLIIIIAVFGSESGKTYRRFSAGRT